MADSKLMIAGETVTAGKPVHIPDGLPETDIAGAASTVAMLLGGDAIDDLRGGYLAYRYIGFNMHEAATMMHVEIRTVHRWRGEGYSVASGYTFRALEQMATSPNINSIRREILHVLFIRNYFMFLKHDYHIIKKFITRDYEQAPAHKEGYPEDVTSPLPHPTAAEERYLIEARKHYTPQQLEAIAALASPNSGQKLDFDQFILSLTRVSSTVNG